jgi:HPt (histidine-containing phosphotransfer) domain-containing protein
MVSAFLEESPNLMAALGQAVAGGLADQTRQAAHTLKASLRFFGAARALQHVLQLEEIGRSGNLDAAEPALAALEAAMTEVTSALEDRRQEGGPATDAS